MDRLDKPVAGFEFRPSAPPPGAPSMAFGLWLGGLLAMAFLAWGAATAQAGQYTVWSCRGPDGGPISAAAWRVQTGDAGVRDLAVTNDCAAGGSLRIEATPVGVLTDHRPVGEALFEPPAGTVISSFKIWRYVAANDGPDAGPYENDYAASLREWPVEGGGEGFVSECPVRPQPRCSFGTPDEPLAEGNLVTEHTWNHEETPGEGLSPYERLGFWVSCVRFGCEPPAAGEGPAAVFELFRAAITVEDDQAPTVAGLGGTVAEAAPVAGVANLLVTATDVGGGVAAFELSVDGGVTRRVPVANGSGDCEAPFSAARPCPPEATRGFSIDTAGLAPGAHTVSGAVVDAAGNATSFGPVAFTVARRVDDPGPGDPGGQHGVSPASAARTADNGTPAVETPRLRLRPASIGGRAGKAPRLRGALTTPAGEPIAGARLRVELSELGRERGGKLTVWTGADGQFAFKVRGPGAHTVIVSYSPVVGGPASRSVHAMVKTPIALRLRALPRSLRNGQTVHFRGSLAGAGRAARGATVQIQAIAGGRWTTVDTVRAGGHGSFSWAHRFRYVERDALFSFRAVVARTPGWPWATVRSPRIRVPIEGSPR